jgi:hypothetical protein
MRTFQEFLNEATVEVKAEAIGEKMSPLNELIATVRAWGEQNNVSGIEIQKLVMFINRHFAYTVL